MSTPASLNPSPLTSFGTHTFGKLFSDDYSTGKATLKAKGQTGNKGEAAYKASLNLKDLSPQQETKFHFPYKTAYLWFATRPEETKVHVDFGEFELVKKQNLFANATFYNNENRTTFRVGSVYNGKSCLSHTRLEWRRQEAFYLLERTQILRGNNTFTFVDEFNLSNQTISKFDFLFARKEQDFDAYLRHETATKSPVPLFAGFGLGNFYLDLIYRYQKHQFGLQLTTFAGADYGASIAAATRQQDVDIKARLNLFTQNLSLSFKGKINSVFGYLLTAQVPVNGQKPKGVGIFPLPIGFTLETTI